MLAPHSSRYSPRPTEYIPVAYSAVDPEPAHYIVIAIDDEPLAPRASDEHRPLPPSLRLARVLGFSLFGIRR